MPRTFRKQAPQYRPERMRQRFGKSGCSHKLHHRTPQANSAAENYAQFDGGMRTFQRRLLHLSHGSVQASEKNGDDDHRRPYKTHKHDNSPCISKHLLVYCIIFHAVKYISLQIILLICRIFVNTEIFC